MNEKATNDSAKLGTNPNGDEGRDAVHIAIVPCRAAQYLSSGCPVALNRNGEAVSSGPGQAVGVVDPFRPDAMAVQTGQWFWLCLYPKTITSLRHVWEHPAFPLSKGASKPMPRHSSANKEESKAWLKEYVRKHCFYWADEIDGGLMLFLNYVKDQRWIYYAGSDCHGLSDVDDADELFRHLSIVLDRRIDASYFEAFTCSC